MANKARLEKLESKAAPKAEIKVIWQDPDTGVYCDRIELNPDRVEYTAQELEAMRADPNLILIAIVHEGMKI